MRYFKPTTLFEISKLWGFAPAIIPSKRYEPLYLRVKKDGTPSELHHGSFVYESNLKPTDIIL